MLSGTGDGRSLVATLREAGIDVVESLAGRTAAARAEVAVGARVGGFGGVAGLEAWLRSEGVDAVVDATHPFAARMGANAATACATVGVPLLRVLRPSWRERPDAVGWAWVPDHAAAARAASRGGRVLLTVGRQELNAYRDLPDVVARVTEPEPGWDTPGGWELVVARGPFTVDDEVALLREREIGVLVSKDAGGRATEAKLDAAAHLGVRVVMVERPALPPGVPSVVDGVGAVAWLAGVRPVPGPPPRRSP